MIKPKNLLKNHLKKLKGALKVHESRKEPDEKLIKSIKDSIKEYEKATK